MRSEPGPRSRVPALLVVTGALLAVVAVSGALRGPGPTPEPQVRPAVSALDVLVDSTQQSLHADPLDAAGWARLGTAYVEKARVTGDPGYYLRAQDALDESLRLAPDGNGEALIGLGVLANARHDFAAAREHGEAARVLLPYTVEVYGVLADAYTQLGDADAASAAVQTMLDTRPGLPALTRASYELELHGHDADASAALERALRLAVSPDEIAFCRYQLGELAWNTGDVDGASEHYEQGLLVAPDAVSLQQGRAKVAWAQGRPADALAGYRAITARSPLPQYLLEYAELLAAGGDAAGSAAQLEVLAVQQRLYAAQGAGDDQVAALIAADHGDAAEALRLAEAEWGRRQSVFSADALGWALHVNGRDAEALVLADRALVLGGRPAGYLFHRGMILAALGRDAEAAAALTEALDRNPYFSPLQAPVARDTLARLGAR